ncbi:MAG: hypothetical protein KJI72_00235 [Patescibacteria group bacterium]|nr:hypothetical protein [Patescibacteria group bacterium]
MDNKKSLWGKRWFRWLIYFIGFILLIIILDSLFNSADLTGPKAVNRVNQLILNNAEHIISLNPNYAFSGLAERNLGGEGFIVTDSIGARWIVTASSIFADNGLAKSLTPDINYSP